MVSGSPELHRSTMPLRRWGAFFLPPMSDFIQTLRDPYLTVIIYQKESKQERMCGSPAYAAAVILLVAPLGVEPRYLRL